MSFYELGTIEYHIRMFIELLFFYVVFFNISGLNIAKNKFFLVIILIPLSFICQSYLEGTGEVFLAIFSYLIFRKEILNKKVLLNSLAMSANIPYLVITAVSDVLRSLSLLNNLTDISYILIELFIEVIFLVGAMFYFRIIHVENILFRYSSNLSFLMLSINYVLIQCFLYLDDFFKFYEQFILGATILLAVQFLLFLLFFVRIIKKQKKTLEERFLREKLQNIILYASYLEQNQIKLQRFIHDYKNLLLTLREAATENNVKLVLQQIDVLSDYSENYFNTTNSNYDHIKNIKNSYLKSLLISKFHIMESKNIKYHFECLDEIDKISINAFDLIRIIGISIDNAMEEAEQIENSEVKIAIYNIETQVEFIIENLTLNENIDISKLLTYGYSTKIGHSGIGLTSIQEIKKKYSNVFIQYNLEQNKFLVQIIILNEMES